MLVLRGRIVGADQAPHDGVVIVRDEVVEVAGAQVTPSSRQKEVLLPSDWWIAPGFIDLHVHGGQGHDVVDGSAEALAAISRLHASHGTTAFCPTVLTSPAPSMLRALETIALSVRADQETAQLLGANLEGPFLNPVRAGAQPRNALRSPDLALMKELYAAAAGCLSIVTLAPELPGAMPLIEWLVERGVVVSIGHSEATYDQCRAAIAAGCRLVTHTFNAMSPLHHRRPGVVGAALTNDEVVAEVIADGVHVSAPPLALLRRAKGPNGVCLVTDCTAALDSDAPRLGDQPVAVVNGAAQLPDGTLAGSVLTMERAVTNYVALAGASETEAIGAATQVPARVLGRSDIGVLEAGKRADIAILDAALKVRATIVAGRLVAGALP